MALNSYIRSRKFAKRAAMIVMFSICLASSLRLLRRSKTSKYVHQMEALGKEIPPPHRIEPRKKPLVTIATVACGSRYEEALTLIKSALIFGKSVTLHFIVFVDEISERVMLGLLQQLKVTSKVKDFSYVIKMSEFPAGEERMWKSMFAPCSSQRLFYPEILPNVSMVLHLDSDTLFLSDVQEIWKIASHMSNGNYLAAVAPEDESSGDGWYNVHARIPFYGKRGLNTGVMLMNLTRMRNFNISSQWQRIYQEYKFKIVWPDQDILNIYFHFKPEHVLPLGCEYNYRAQHCHCGYEGDCSCRKAMTQGVKVLHGNRIMFHSSTFLPFRNIYQVFRNFSFADSSLVKLMEELDLAVNLVPEGTPCKGLKGTNFFEMPSGKLMTVLDSSIQCNVVELSAQEKAAENYICTPVFPVKSLHIRQPIFVMVVKNLHDWFSFELSIVDSSKQTITLRGSTLQEQLDIRGSHCDLPLHFTEGWNQVQIDLNDFTIRCFGTSYWETMSVKVSSSCYLHRLYFCESINRNLPHKFTSASSMLLNPDRFPGGDGDGFERGSTVV